MHAPRRRTLRLAALLALTLLTTAAAAAFIRRALACPIEIPPQTLRTLYKHSDRIVVARVGHTELVERDEDSSQVRTALHVARNVKGKDEGPVVFVHHSTWVEEGVEKPGTYKQGEQLLVFLERGDEEEGRAVYTVDDATYGVKMLSDDDLKVYLARIDELAGIEGRKPADKAALVEWLVRCAEEPATRWEGAYELMVSTQALEHSKEQRERQPSEAEIRASVPKHHATAEEYEADVARALAVAWGEAAVAPTSPAPPPGEAALAPPPGVAVEREPVELRRATPRDPSLAAALSEEQQRRLADALFGAEKIGVGEGALLHVVKGFQDARLVPFLVAQLRRVEDNPPTEAEEWLAVLSEVSNNEEAVHLITNYSANVTYYEEEEEMTAGDESAGTDKAAAVDEEESAGTDEEFDQKEQDARDAAATERATKKRSALLKDLLARVERILASPDVAHQ
ncbi:MAG TPA: hypothetical protein VF064_07980 [Pyrinomonadaceae bacterium]